MILQAQHNSELQPPDFPSFFKDMINSIILSSIAFRLLNDNSPTKLKYFLRQKE